MPDQESDIAEIMEEVAAYYNELDGESPRAAAILALASLEDELNRLIRSKFPSNLSNTVWKKIAAPGTFQAKANVAHAFGFFGHQTRAAIETMGTIRNRFAHRPKIRDFGHKDIVAECRKLNQWPPHPVRLIEGASANDVRWIFVQSVRELERRLAQIRRYIPELDDEKPDPLP